MSEKGFAEALGKIPSGIFVVTATRAEESGALLSSWVQQASFDPPTLSMAVHKDRPLDRLLKEHATFALNILKKEDKLLYTHFAKNGGMGPEAFQGIEIEVGAASGAPLLRDALAVLECRVRSRLDVGDHHLVVADILDGRMNHQGDPKVHIRKSGLTY